MHVGCKMPSVEFELIDLDINEPIALNLSQKLATAKVFSVCHLTTRLSCPISPSTTYYIPEAHQWLLAKGSSANIRFIHIICFILFYLLMGLDVPSLKCWLSPKYVLICFGWVLWRCKECNVSPPAKFELLKHFRLQHCHRQHYPCPHTNCQCTFKTWNALHIQVHTKQNSPNSLLF